MIDSEFFLEEQKMDIVKAVFFLGIIFVSVSAQVVDLNHLGNVEFTGSCALNGNAINPATQPVAITFQTYGSNIKSTPEGVVMQWKCDKLSQTTWKDIFISPLFARFFLDVGLFSPTSISNSVR